MSERRMPDGSWALQQQIREREDAEKRMRKGIWMAQNAPESIEQILSFACAVVDHDGDRRAIAVMLPSGKQIQLVMRPQLCESLAHELLGEKQTESRLELPG